MSAPCSARIQRIIATWIVFQLLLGSSAQPPETARILFRRRPHWQDYATLQLALETPYRITATAFLNSNACQFGKKCSREAEEYGGGHRHLVVGDAAGFLHVVQLDDGEVVRYAGPEEGQAVTVLEPWLHWSGKTVGLVVGFSNGAIGLLRVPSTTRDTKALVILDTIPSRASISSLAIDNLKSRSKKCSLVGALASDGGFAVGCLRTASSSTTPAAFPEFHWIIESNATDQTRETMISVIAQAGNLYGIARNKGAVLSLPARPGTSAQRNPRVCTTRHSGKTHDVDKDYSVDFVAVARSLPFPSPTHGLQFFATTSDGRLLGLRLGGKWCHIQWQAQLFDKSAGTNNNLVDLYLSFKLFALPGYVLHLQNGGTPTLTIINITSTLLSKRKHNPPSVVLRQPLPELLKQEELLHYRQAQEQDAVETHCGIVNNNVAPPQTCARPLSEEQQSMPALAVDASSKAIAVQLSDRIMGVYHLSLPYSARAHRHAAKHAKSRPLAWLQVVQPLVLAVAAGLVFARMSFGRRGNLGPELASDRLMTRYVAPGSMSNPSVVDLAESVEDDALEQEPPAWLRAIARLDDRTRTRRCDKDAFRMSDLNDDGEEDVVSNPEEMLGFLSQHAFDYAPLHEADEGTNRAHVVLDAKDANSGKELEQTGEGLAMMRNTDRNVEMLSNDAPEAITEFSPLLDEEPVSDEAACSAAVPESPNVGVQLEDTENKRKPQKR